MFILKYIFHKQNGTLRIVQSFIIEQLNQKEMYFLVIERIHLFSNELKFKLKEQTKVTELAYKL